jgi:hypothetical protein
MKTLFANADVGRKNLVFGVALFLLLGVVIGIPLTIDFLGGSLLASDQYQIWKVVHGYGVFLAFINYFLGTTLDRLDMSRPQKEIVSWSFLVAGVVGGAGRMILVLMSSLGVYGPYASLIETMLFVLGTIFFVRGQVQEKASHPLKSTSQPQPSSRAR